MANDSHDRSASPPTLSQLHKNLLADNLVDRDATLRGNPVLKNDHDRNCSEDKVSEPDATNRQFRLRRRKNRKRQRKAQHKKKARQENIEMEDVAEDADKRRGGFRLSPKEQITPADTVSAEASADEVCCPSPFPFLSKAGCMLCVVFADPRSCGYAPGHYHS